MKKIGVLVVVVTFLVGIFTFEHLAFATMYAFDDSTDTLYIIDTTTGAATLVGPAAQELNLTGLAYNTANSTMYVSDVDVGGGAWGLGSVDLTTGAVTIIGSHVTSNDIFGLSFIGGTLYGADKDHDSLVTIDLVTGAIATTVGPFNHDAGEDGFGIECLAYDAGTDTLFGMGWTNLYTINRTTGLATKVGPHGIPISDYLGCEVGSETGILYAAGNESTGNLYSINKVTGVATPIGPTGIQVSSLADVPPAKPVGIPTMNEWGMIIFAVLAGLGAVCSIRRQTTANG